MLDPLHRKHCLCLGYAVLVVASFFFTTVMEAQEPQRTQEELATALRSSDIKEAYAALGAIPIVRGQHGPKIAPGFTISPELASALLYAFEKGLEQREREKRGDPSATFSREYGEMFLEFTWYLSALRDPVTIPVLMRVAGLGWAVRNPLLAFGPRIVPEAILCAEDSKASYDAVDGCLWMLAYAVPLWGDTFDASTRARIREIAVLYVDGPPEHYASSRYPWATFSSAIDLAFVLGGEGMDDDLKARVRARAAKEPHFNNEDDYWGKKLQDRLAGIPSASVAKVLRDHGQARHDR